MKILICNDDGYFAPGIRFLEEALSQFAETKVVAPERDRSGASNSLTLDRPLFLRQAFNQYYYVNGTPTDCVHLVATGALDYSPGLVVSGINAGANMGDDTIYSGTVAAATEGYLFGISGMAFSMTTSDPQYFETGAKVAENFVKKFQSNMFEHPVLLNINIPDIPYEQIKGIKVTRLGRRHKAKPVIDVMTPRNQKAYWIGSAGDVLEAGEDTDFYAIENGYVSITPLQIDLTHYKHLADVARWCL